MVPPTTVAIRLAALLTCMAGCYSPPESGPSNTPDEPGAAPATSAQQGVLAGVGAGVRYRTPRLEALTDESGRFAYFPGEIVRFSIGDIELGSAFGAARLDFFALNDVRPPATETELVVELDDQRNVRGFDRAHNAMAVLLAFDRDDDPRNGLDLVGVDTLLKGHPLTLDVDASVFVDEHFAPFAQRAALPWNNVTTSDALVMLYDSIGLRVAAHMRTARYDDQNSDGVAESQESYTNDGSTRRATITSTVASDSSYTLTTITRDARGREVGTTWVRTYDPSVAQPETRGVSVTTSDVRGHELERIDTTTTGSTLIAKVTRSKTRDAASRPVTGELTVDYGNTTGPAQHGTTAYTYAATRIATNETLAMTQQPTTETSVSTDYDAVGRVARIAQTGDGSDYEQVNERDANGLIIRQVTTQTDAIGGVVHTTITTTRDSAGRVLRTFYESDNGDRYEQTMTYDLGKRLVALDYEQSNGTSSTTGHQFWVYGPEGHVSQTGISTQAVTASATSRQTWQRDLTFRAGALVEMRTRYDNDGDGTYEQNTTTRYEHTVVADGVRYIADNIVEWRP